MQSWWSTLNPYIKDSTLWIGDRSGKDIRQSHRVHSRRTRWSLGSWDALMTTQGAFTSFLGAEAVLDTERALERLLEGLESFLGAGTGTVFCGPIEVEIEVLGSSGEDDMPG